MRQNIEDFAEIMVNAQPNERYWFAIKAKSVIPHVFRIQKVRLAESEDCDLFVIVNDEGFVERAYNWSGYLGYDRPHTASVRRRAVAHILWDYLHDYNREMRMPAPIDLGEEADADTMEGYKARQQAIDDFLYRPLSGIGKY